MVDNRCTIKALCAVFSQLCRCVEAKQLIVQFVVGRSQNDVEVHANSRKRRRRRGGGKQDSDSGCAKMVRRFATAEVGAPNNEEEEKVDRIVLTFQTLAGLPLLCGHKWDRKVPPLTLNKTRLPRDLLDTLRRHVIPARPADCGLPRLFHNVCDMDTEAATRQCVDKHDPSTGPLVFETVFERRWSTQMDMKRLNAVVGHRVSNIAWHPSDPQCALVWHFEEDIPFTQIYLVKGIGTDHVSTESPETGTFVRPRNVHRIEWDPTGKMFVVMTIYVFHYYKVIDVKTGSVVASGKGQLRGCGFWSHDGSFFMSSNYDGEFGTIVDTGEWAPVPRPPKSSFCEAGAVFHPKEPLIAGPRDYNTIHLFDTSLNLLHVWTPEPAPDTYMDLMLCKHCAPFNCASVSAWSPCGSMLAVSTHCQKTVKVWRVHRESEESRLDFSKGSVIAELSNMFTEPEDCVETLQWSPSSDYLVVMSEGYDVLMWSPRTLTWMAPWHNNRVHTIRWNCDGTMLATKDYVYDSAGNCTGQTLSFWC